MIQDEIVHKWWQFLLQSFLKMDQVNFRIKLAFYHFYKNLLRD